LEGIYVVYGNSEVLLTTSGNSLLHANQETSTLAFLLFSQGKKKPLFSNLFEDAQIRVHMTSIKEG
jgi:hypothetical protein